MFHTTANAAALKERIYFIFRVPSMPTHHTIAALLKSAFASRPSFLCPVLRSVFLYFVCCAAWWQCPKDSGPGHASCRCCPNPRHEPPAVSHLVFLRTRHARSTRCRVPCQELLRCFHVRFTQILAAHSYRWDVGATILEDAKRAGAGPLASRRVYKSLHRCEPSLRRHASERGRHGGLRQGAGRGPAQGPPQPLPDEDARGLGSGPEARPRRKRQHLVCRLDRGASMSKLRSAPPVVSEDDWKDYRGDHAQGFLRPLPVRPAWGRGFLWGGFFEHLFDEFGAQSRWTPANSLLVCRGNGA